MTNLCANPALSRLSKVAAAYIMSSYLFFPVFLALHTDFRHGIIFGDIGITPVRFVGLVASSPYLVGRVGTEFPSVLYWCSFLFVFVLSWFVLSRLSARRAPSS